MKIAVAVKQVDIVSDELALTPDGKAADPQVLDRALNEWDASAVEQALRLREQLGDGEVVVVTVGDGEADAALRRALAMGANRAIRVEGRSWDALSTARALHGPMADEAPELVFCGVQSSDSVQGSTGVALAQLLGYSWAAVVTKIRWDGAGPLAVERELDAGIHETVELDPPALLTIQTGIIQPRYVTLRAIKQAEAKPITVVRPHLAEKAGFEIRRMFAPPKQREATALAGSPREMAEQIATIIKERLR